MPLTISGPGPVNGTLSPGVPLADLVMAIPSLVGAWTAEDLPASGLVQSWTARHGGGVLTQPNVTRQPSVGAQGGVKTLICGPATPLYGPKAGWTDGSPGSVGIRAYWPEPLTDLQYLLAFGAAYRVVWRSAGYLRVDAAADINLTVPGTGWTDFILRQSATTTTAEAFGVTGAAANTGIAGTQFVLGAGTATATANGFRGQISRVILAASDVGDASHLAAVRAWLAS